MKQAIVIGTMPGREAWLNDCLASLEGCGVEVVTIQSQNFELSVIELASRLYDEFIFLPDSTEVLDHVSLVDECFGTTSSVSLSQFPGPYGMYLGKYVSNSLAQISFPFVRDKLDAVHYETVWTGKYVQIASTKVLGNLPHSDNFVERHGRLNMVCENHWLRRFKASWNGETMNDEHQRIQELRGLAVR